MIGVPDKTRWLGIGSVVVFVLLWIGLTDSWHVFNPLFVPSPQAVFSALNDLVWNHQFVYDIVFTVGRVLIAFSLSIICALPTALVLKESRIINRIVSPYIDFIRYIPVPVLIPLMILFFGIDETAKIALLFFGTVFQLILLFVADLARTPAEYFDLAYTLHFSRFEKIKLQVLANLPSLYTNTRISLGLCWSYVVIAELVAADTGIGHMIKEAQRFSHTSNVYVGIIVMGCIGLISDSAFRFFYPKLFPYTITK